MKRAMLASLLIFFLPSCTFFRCLFSACENTVEVVVDPAVKGDPSSLNGGNSLLIDIVPIPGAEKSRSTYWAMTAEQWFRGGRNNYAGGRSYESWTVDDGEARFLGGEEGQDRPMPFKGTDRDTETWGLVVFANYNSPSAEKKEGRKIAMELTYLDKARKILVTVNKGGISVSVKKVGK